MNILRALGPLLLVIGTVVVVASLVAGSGSLLRAGILLVIVGFTSSVGGYRWLGGVIGRSVRR
jgi:uncharacterized membrane protein